MRRWLFALLVMTCASAFAQTRPPALEPLPEPPPMPAPGVDEPKVRIPVQVGDKVEPIRRAGQVVAVRVTPPHGKPYFIIDTTGNGNWMRRDSLDDGARFPMFIIFEFD